MTTQHAIALVLLCALGTFVESNAIAASIYGTVGFVGTINQYTASNEGYQAQLRVKVVNSTCKTNTGENNQPTDRWIGIRSGRMDGQFAHNSVNFRNAFSLLMAAFLSGKMVQIDGPLNCNTSNTIDLWSSTVGMY